jgi:hypothetical protein
MSFEESEWEREDREIHEAFRAKDAEIARLKALLCRAAEALDNGDLEILQEMREASRE